MSERPRTDQPRRLRDWLNPKRALKVHSLVDKIYKRKNLELAWERVRSNQGAGGVDGQSIAEFEEQLDQELDRLHHELKTNTYVPQPVRRHTIPKAGQPGRERELGIPTIYDRVCQQAIRNRLEPIFEEVFDEASFGYRRGRSTKDALRKVWGELNQGYEWIVDADLRDYFGSVDHEKLMVLVNQRISDGRVLRLLEGILHAGYQSGGRLYPTGEGVPQGGVVSPLLSNIFLTPFDREMRLRGYNFTRYADDWLVTCRTRRDAELVLREAEKILKSLGVRLNREKTRIVHVRYGFEFLGYKIKRGRRALRLSASKIRSGTRQGSFYAYPRQKSLEHFKDQIRKRTRRKAPLRTHELIEEINPVIRGWGQHYCRAHVRKLFQHLDGWIVCRLRSHRHKRWRNQGWKALPESKLYKEMGLVRLVALIPSLRARF